MVSCVLVLLVRWGYSQLRIAVVLWLIWHLLCYCTVTGVLY